MSSAARTEEVLAILKRMHPGVAIELCAGAPESIMFDSFSLPHYHFNGSPMEEASLISSIYEGVLSHEKRRKQDEQTRDGFLLLAKAFPSHRITVKTVIDEGAAYQLFLAGRRVESIFLPNTAYNTTSFTQSTVIDGFKQYLEEKKSRETSQ